MKTAINWKSYWQDSQIEEYNLKNTENIKLFDVNNLNMDGAHQINYLNIYLGELVMMYYIWKNNIKSDYIVISQYRRDFTNIDYNRLDNDEVQFIYHWIDHNKVNNRLFIQDFFGKKLDHDPDNFFKTKLFEYIKTYYNFSDNEIENYLNKEHNDNIACIVFGCNWKKYCEICEFTFGYLDYMFPKGSWKSPKTLLDFRDNRYEIYKKYYGEIDEWNIYMDNRYFVFIIEILFRDILPLFCKTFSNNEKEFNTNLYTIIDDSFYTDERMIGLFYKKNLKIIPNNIFFLVKDEEKYKQYYNFFIEMYNWQFYKIKIISDENEIPHNSYKLNYDEYFDFDELNDFYSGNYIIKKITF